MEFVETDVPGLIHIRLAAHEDSRGRFVKVFHEPTFRGRGLAAHFSEEFYSESSRGVLRGLHFQTPPHASIKLVYCVAGRVLDAVVDLRRGSPAFGRPLVFELDGREPSAICVPAGVAHGFYVLSETALMVYKTTEPYSAPHDLGVRWDSCGIPWPNSAPVVSSRDAGFPALADFDSPFSFTGK